MAAVKGSAYKFPKEGGGKTGDSPQMHMLKHGKMPKTKHKRARK